MATPQNNNAAKGVDSSLSSSSTKTSNSSPMILGVSPKELYTTSVTSSVLNRKITPDDFLTMVIFKSKNGLNSKVEKDTVITFICESDSFNIGFGSEYTRPMTGSGGNEDGMGFGTLNKLMGIGSGVSNLTKAFGGFSIQNKLKNLPVWASNSYLTFELKCFLIATSDPITQVEVPLVLLSNLVTPTTDPDDNFKLLSPGPVFDQAEWKKTSDQAGSDGKSVSQSYKQLDPTVLFNGGDIITLKMGGLAEIGPLIIKSVNYSVPNQYVKNKPSGLGNSIFGNSFSKLPGK